MSRIAKVYFAIVATLIIIIGIYEAILQSAYSRVEKLTNEYGLLIQPIIAKEINTNEKNGRMSIEIHLEYIKVFDVTSDSGKVYLVTNTTLTHSYGYVQRDRTGFYVYLKRDGNEWAIDSAKPEEMIWDQYGAADGMTWPPYH